MFGISSILKRFLGDNNDKEIARYREIVDQINGFEPAMTNLTDDKLTGYTRRFREQIDNGAPLEEILPEAFAVVRETSRRVLGMRHFDVQLIGGICLHEGRIAEMRTGEGKTLVATTAVYLNALSGRGVHMVTVNDYLARRDSEWMGKLYRYLGLSVGLIAHNMDFPERKAAYASDVTFGTNNEFGFDYLRDNMVLSESQMVQRDLHYAIVDEVDSILIDEARTPLIISGPGTKSTDNYAVMANAVRHLKEGEDYTVDEKQKTVAPADSAVPKIEKLVGIQNLYAPENIELSHCFTAALRAKALMHRDRDYVVRNDEIVIVDEFTGRLMEGRRYSDGLHQAIEAKEGVKIQRESQTLASITFQNYFRMYEKLAGMTGTAKTEENGFLKIYKLPVIVIPTNKPVQRIDHPDVIYKTKAAKYRAVGQSVKDIHASGQPVLIGTTSITQSEEMSNVLRKNGIPHVVLNAKFHEKEAEIVANAGQKGAVTIATNMAGRGTDIKLGEGVEELGGLFI
ncbi:MAG: preprotein translocase subunit SecA, partial [Selenomonas artemidis]